MGHVKSRSDSLRCFLFAGFVVALISVSGESAQARNLQWAKRAGGTSGETGFGIAVDGAGNSYVTGDFGGSATFGPGDPSQTVLTSAGQSDIFVAKYDSSGALVWAKRAGGSSSDLGRGIAVDGLGNSYVTGNFDGSATFGLGEPNQTMLTSDGSSDVFVAKYDSSGALVWAKRAGGTSIDSGTSIAMRGSENFYVTGLFALSATFGPGEPNQTMLNSGGPASDIFVAKYDSTGALVWAKQAGGTAADIGSGIAVDASGNSYVTGHFLISATFGLGEPNQTTLTSDPFATGSDTFVAKYHSSGALIWAKQAGGLEADRGVAIAVDGGENSYIVGVFNGTVILGPGDPNQTELISAGQSDIFVARYDSTGALDWAKRAGGTGFDGGAAGIAVDGSGNSYVTGRFDGTATFGSGEFNETTLVSAGGLDFFLAKYNSLGALVWAKRGGGTSQDFGMAIALDGPGNAYVTGVFATTATFGPGESKQTTLVSAGASDMFVAKVSGNRADLDGDGKADIAVYRDGAWYIIRSSDGGITTVGWGGAPQDIPVPTDYDGDGKKDIAVYRDGVWFIIRSSDGGTTIVGWGGLAQDIPVPADYDGDGKADIAVYRDGVWFIIRSSDGGATIVGWGGLAHDIPVPADYDGDGRTDIAVYRDGLWFIIRSSDGGITTVGWGGAPQDIPVPADYDGDGRTDIAVYRDGLWFIIRSSDGGITTVGWGGAPQDIPFN